MNMTKWFSHFLVVSYFLAGPALGMALVFLTYDVWESWLSGISRMNLSLILIFGGGFSVGVAWLPSFLIGGICGFLLPLPFALPAVTLAISLAVFIGICVGDIMGSSLVKDITHLRPNWQKIWGALENVSPKTLISMLISLRLAPQVPFALTNLICAHIPTKRSHIILGSIFGLLPRTYLAVIIGSGVYELKELFNQESSLYGIIFSGIVVMVIVGFFYFLRKKLIKESLI